MELPVAALVSVALYDLSGRIVAEPLADELLPAGRTVRRWSPGALESGLYWMRLTFPGGHRVRSLVWLGGR